MIFALFSAPFVACNEPFHETNDLGTMEQGLLHRELQFTDACNASLEELYADEALNEADMMYTEAFDAALAGNSSLDGCVESETSFTCDFSPPIDGEEELTSACTAAGGEILSLSMDLSCTGMVNGTAGTLEIDLPTALKCIPSSPDFASCADTLREAFQNFTDLYVYGFEKILTFSGVSDASCTSADVGGDTGGSDNGGGGSGGSGADDSDNGGGSSASSLSLLISFGVMAILSLTIG